MECVFHGPDYRAQISVIDFSEWREYQQEKGKVADCRHTSFSVRVLPQSSNKYTAFHTGYYVYRGGCFATAWFRMKRAIGIRSLAVPDKLRPYAEEALTCG